MEITASQLQVALGRSWTKDTSSTPTEWSETNASRGQCVPTALIIQDYLGGNLQKLQTTYYSKTETHYRNILDNKTIIDVCRSQYPASQKLTVVDVKLDNFATIRDKLMSVPDVHSRYVTLKKRIDSYVSRGEWIKDAERY